jgi:hypothetical protein
VVLRENVGGGPGCMVEAMRPSGMHTQPRRDVFEPAAATSVHPEVRRSDSILRKVGSEMAS